MKDFLLQNSKEQKNLSLFQEYIPQIQKSVQYDLVHIIKSSIIVVINELKGHENLVTIRCTVTSITNDHL